MRGHQREALSGTDMGLVRHSAGNFLEGFEKTVVSLGSWAGPSCSVGTDGPPQVASGLVWFSLHVQPAERLPRPPRRAEPGIS